MGARSILSGAGGVGCPAGRLPARPPRGVNRYDKVGSESATTAQERTGGGAQLAPVDPTAAPVDPTVARVARQPILDRDSRLIGYELLFRARQADTAGVLDDREATSAVILDGMVDVGLSDLVGKNLAFLNVSRDFLLSVRPLPLPAHQVVPSDRDLLRLGVPVDPDELHAVQQRPGNPAQIILDLAGRTF